MNFALWNGSQRVWCCCKNTQVRGCCDDPYPLQQNSTNDSRVCHWVTVSPLHTPGLQEMPASLFVCKDCKGKAYVLYKGRTWRFFPPFLHTFRMSNCNFSFILVTLLFWFLFSIVIFFFPYSSSLFSFLFVHGIHQTPSPVASLLNSLLFLFLVLLIFFSAYPPICFLFDTST